MLRVDVNTFKANETLAKVEKVVDIPQAQLLNGATVLSREEGTLLIANSVLGSVFRVNTRSKEVKVVIKDPLFDITPASTVGLGLNGLSLPRNGELFFTNTNQGLLGRISIQFDGTPKAKAEVLSRGVALADDFAVGRNGGFSLRRMCLISCLLFLLVGEMQRCWSVRMTGLGSRDQLVLPS